jgi:hypothetical protein
VLKQAPNHEDLLGVEVQHHASLTSALEGGEWSGSRPGCLIPGEVTQYPLDWGLSGPQRRFGRGGEY